VLAAVGWPDVGIALIAGLPGIIAAFAALSVRQSVKTPSGTSVGKQVENMHHTALANNYRLQALGDGFDVPMPEKASREEARIERQDDDDRVTP
jgi:hypothetical protein